MNIDDLKYIIDPNDPIEDMLRFEGYNQAIDDLHKRGLLMVWNYDLLAMEKIETEQPFLVLQDGEIYHAKYDQYRRIMWRTHSLLRPHKYREIEVEYNGEIIKAHAFHEYDEEEFLHSWCLWTRGFEFKPEAFMKLPKGDA
jgi:hypothetical protein